LQTTSYFSASNSRIVMSGSNVQILAPSFYLGSTTNFISGSNNRLRIVTDFATISGSQVQVLSPSVFFGLATTSFISASNSQVLISGSGVRILTPSFYIGGTTNFISGSNNRISVRSDLFTLSSSNMMITDNGASPAYFQLGTVLSSSAGTSFSGFWINQQGNFIIKAGAVSDRNYILGTGAGLSIHSDNFILSGSTTLVIDTTKIVLGTNAYSQTLTSGTGIFQNTSGHWRAGNAAGQHIRWDGSNVIISASNASISGSTGWLGANTVLSWNSSRVTLSGFTANAVSLTGSTGIGLYSGFDSFTSQPFGAALIGLGSDPLWYIEGGDYGYDAARGFVIDDKNYFVKTLFLGTMTTAPIFRVGSTTSYMLYDGLNNVLNISTPILNLGQVNNSIAG